MKDSPHDVLLSLLTLPKQAHRARPRKTRDHLQAFLAGVIEARRDADSWRTSRDADAARR